MELPPESLKWEWKTTREGKINSSTDVSLAVDRFWANTDNKSQILLTPHLGY